MIGFTIEPLMYAGEVTTYRVHAVRADGSHYWDFGATRDLAFRFGLRAMQGEETRDPYAIQTRLPIVYHGSEFVPATTFVHA